MKRIQKMVQVRGSGSGIHSPGRFAVPLFFFLCLVLLLSACKKEEVFNDAGAAN